MLQLQMSSNSSSTSQRGTKEVSAQLTKTGKKKVILLKQIQRFTIFQQ